MSLYGQDMDPAVTPFECGLSWTVDMGGERDFVGRNALRERPRRFQALGLYRRAGFTEVDCWGEYASAPTSVCYEKNL